MYLFRYITCMQVYYKRMYFISLNLLPIKNVYKRERLSTLIKLIIPYNLLKTNNLKLIGLLTRT